MILIFCPKCQEARSLTQKALILCQCGASWGRYTDPDSATIGGAAIPIGLANDSIRRAIKGRPSEGYGHIVDALVLPHSTPFITYDNAKPENPGPETS